MRTWQLQEAKNKFSELIDRAKTEGPQQVTRHGKADAVILSQAEYDRLIASPPKMARSFAEHLLAIPKGKEPLIPKRRKQTKRAPLFGDE